MSLIADPNLKKYATDRQWEYLEAIAQHGSVYAAAKALGVDKTTVRQARDTVKRRAAQNGYAPDHGLTYELPKGMTSKGTSVRYGPDGQIEQFWNKSKMAGRPEDEAVRLPDPKKIVKVSTLYDQQGEVTQQWVSEKPEDVAREKLWLAWQQELLSKLEPLEPRPAPESGNADRLAVYPVGDHHNGMLAWKAETGESWDLKISEQTFVDCFGYLVNASPASDTALIPFLGDLSHYDSFKPITPAHGHLLDADSRFPKMAFSTLRIIRRSIELALAKHKNVHLIIEFGNHDPSSTVFLMAAISALYEKEPRVTVDTSPMFFHYFRFGKVLIGTNHGDKVKGEKLPLIMATDRPEDWGATLFRLWLLGHVHHFSAKDHPGCSVETAEVLPPEDAHAHQSGYRSKRGMKSIIFDANEGEMGRHFVRPSMFRRAA
jgi:hypothetical protein